MKFIKKPIVIEAEQWIGYPTPNVEEFVGDALIMEDPMDGSFRMNYRIKTLEGHSYMLRKGDWILQGIDGEFYPCKPGIFNRTYNEYVEKF